MQNIQWRFLLYAIGAIGSLIGLGVSISFHNVFVNVLFLVLFFMFMGIGFSQKRKLQKMEEQ